MKVRDLIEELSMLDQDAELDRDLVLTPFYQFELKRKKNEGNLYPNTNKLKSGTEESIEEYRNSDEWEVVKLFNNGYPFMYKLGLK